MDYINKLSNLQMVTLITTGRTGTDYLQSTFDSHPEILTFNGSLWLHTFWSKSICINNSRGNIVLDDLIFEFIGLHLEKLKSQYDILERKDQLGDNSDQFLNIDLEKFRDDIKITLQGKVINSKSFLIAVYAAYGIQTGYDLEGVKVILHHIHHFDKLDPFISDFPNAKIICMTRDPRANFVSGIENHRLYNIATDHNAHLYHNIKRILNDSTPLKIYSNEYITIKLEDLGNMKIILKLCDWLKIRYHISMEKSTWGGLQWKGDRVSKRKNNVKGFSEKMLDNKWESKLSFIDKYLLNYIMFNRIKYYDYPYKKITYLDSLIIPFFILMPLSYELRFFSFKYLLNNIKSGNYKIIVSNFFYYLKRINLFFKFYTKTVTKKIYDEPLLKIK